ncbi:hypothetical protein ACYDLZ_06495 [Staphylococcus succinus]
MEYEASFDFYIEEVKHAGEVHKNVNNDNRLVIINGDYMIAKIHMGEFLFEDLSTILNHTAKYYMRKGFKSKDNGVARDIVFGRIVIANIVRPLDENKLTDLEDKHNVYLVSHDFKDSNITIYGIAYIHEDDKNNFIQELRDIYQNPDTDFKIENYTNK